MRDDERARRKPGGGGPYAGEHTVAVLIRSDGGALGPESALPLAVFGDPDAGAAGTAPYRLIVCHEADAGRVLAGLGPDGTVVVPDRGSAEARVRRGLCEALRDVHEAGARLVGIGTGVELLAESGVLDGKAAGVESSSLREYTESYGRVRWVPDQLVSDGRVLTSPGGGEHALGICLRVVWEDHGPPVARRVRWKFPGVGEARREAAPAPYSFPGSDHRVAVVSAEPGAGASTTTELLSAALQTLLSEGGLARRTRAVAAGSPTPVGVWQRWITLVDCGAGTPPDVQAAELRRADQLIVVAGASAGAPAVYSAFSRWLSTRVRPQAMRSGILAFSPPGARTWTEDVGELAAVFRTFSASLHLPYDAEIAEFGLARAELSDSTRRAFAYLARLVLEEIAFGGPEAGGPREEGGPRQDERTSYDGTEPLPRRRPPSADHGAAPPPPPSYGAAPPPPPQPAYGAPPPPPPAPVSPAPESPDPEPPAPAWEPPATQQPLPALTVEVPDEYAESEESGEPDEYADLAEEVEAAAETAEDVYGRQIRVEGPVGLSAAVDRAVMTGPAPAVSQEELREVVAELAERAAPGREVPLQVRVVCGASGIGQALRPFAIPPEGTLLSVTVHAPGLLALGDLQQQVRVWPGQDSDVLRFGLRTLDPGLHTVTVRVFREGSFLGEVRPEISVEPGSPTLDGPRTSGLVHTSAFEPGEVTLQVLPADAPGSYTFQLLGSVCYEPEVYRFRSGDPREASEQIYAELRLVARGSGAGTGQSDADWRASRRQRLRGHGVQLWATVVPQAVQRQFWEQVEHITAFTVLGEHDIVPWELLYPLEPGRPDRGFLAEWLPVVRRVHGQDRVGELGLGGAAFIVPPGSPADATEEVERLRVRLGAAGHGVVTARARLTELIEGGGSGVLHFACHNSLTAGGSQVTMDDGLFDPVDLAYAAQLRTLRRSRPLVFFNACRSASDIDWFGASLGWAPQFLRAGAGAFVGTLWPVRSEAALLFADAFYRELVERGQPLGQASLRARQAVREAGDDPAWLAYAVYGSPAAVSRAADPWEVR